MTKLAWVVLPLLGALAWLAVLAWRGRWPSRITMNVVSSLLLLAYLAVTAGLGIFWVAHQHLPVFDWHYLFGYATVALVVLHLAFNFRVVWHHLARRRRATSSAPGRLLHRPAEAPTRPQPADGIAPARDAVPGRRPVLGVLGGAGALLALGGGYLLGLRHGRTELVVSPTAPGAAPGDAAAALAVVEQFHEFSAHSRLGVFRRAPGTAWGSPPPPFKALPGQRLVLPPPRRAAGGSPPTPLEAASTLLWMTAGVSEDRGGIAFRTAPSSGALFASEFYLIAHALPGIEPGAWHYEPRGHALVRLADAGALPPAALPGAPATVVASAIFPRSGHKYRDRTYRYVLADLGHALENLRVAAGALGGSIGFVRVFDDAPWGQALGLDPAEEGVLALAGWAPAGTPAAGTPPAAPPGPWRVPMPEAGAALGVTDAIHRATSLRAPGAQPTPGPPDAAAPGGAGPATATGRASAGAVDLPRPAVAPRDLLATIASRRSRRRYRTQAIALPALTEVLAALPGPGPLWSPALRIDVVTHAVDGLPPGAWRYEPAQQQLHRAFAAIGPGGAAAPDAAAWRRRSRSAGLGQDAIGDAAAVVVLSIDRAAFAADPAGPARGYRHAFLEAGAAGERLYLAAPALGLGVCAVGAFYDDEASALVGIDPSREWVVHFAALGIV